MIYLFDKIDSFSDELFWRTLQVIPQERVKKALAFQNMVDRKLSVIAYLLLVYGMRKEYGIVEELIFVFGKNEKPYLRDYPEIFFNISHCKAGVVCAISNKEVGIDIEQVRDYDEDVAKYICNEREYYTLCNSRQQALDFCKLWTIKESVVKFSQEGICQDLKSILPNTDVEIETSYSCDYSYVISVCKR